MRPPGSRYAHDQYKNVRTNSGGKTWYADVGTAGLSKERLVKLVDELKPARGSKKIGTVTGATYSDAFLAAKEADRIRYKLFGPNSVGNFHFSEEEKQALEQTTIAELKAEILVRYEV